MGASTKCLPFCLEKFHQKNAICFFLGNEDEWFVGLFFGFDNADFFFLLDVSKDCKGHEFPAFQRMEYSEAEKLKDPGNRNWHCMKGRGKFGVQLHWQEKCGMELFLASEIWEFRRVTLPETNIAIENPPF